MAGLWRHTHTVDPMNESDAVDIERVEHSDQILALVLRASFSASGIEFFTEDHLSQQLGFMSRPKGYVVQPHRHRHVARTVTRTQEVLFVRRGRVRVDLFLEDGHLVRSVTLNPGDVIMLIDGGHALEMLEMTEIIEVKQGPYTGDMDKEILTPKAKK